MSQPGRTITLEHLGGHVWARVGAHGHNIDVTVSLPKGGTLTLQLSRQDALTLAETIRDVAGTPRVYGGEPDEGD